MMWALKVTRSMTAATRRASGMTWPHSLNGRFDAMADGGLLFAFGEDLEQQLGAAAVELDVADLVDAEQVEASVAGDECGRGVVRRRLRRVR